MRDATNLQDVEGGRVEKVEGDEIEDPDNIVHARNAAQVPQGRATISVVDEVDQCESCQRQADQGKDNTIGSCSYQVLTCVQTVSGYSTYCHR